jgi:hypothetical protein
METINEENNNNDIIEPTKKKVRNKSKLFEPRRKEVLERLYIIILDKENGFYSHEIENNEEIKQQIENLNEDILKYFNVSTWSSFKKDLILEKKTMSTIKSLLRDMNVKFETVSGKLKINNIQHNTTRYKILDRNN